MSRSPAPMCQVPPLFTVNLRNCRRELLGPPCRSARRNCPRHQRPAPVHIDAWVVLPDHMHCIWTLPDGDAALTLRWKITKFAFARRLPNTALAASGRRFVRQRTIDAVCASLPAVEGLNGPYHPAKEQACPDGFGGSGPAVVNEQAKCGCIERLAGNQLRAERQRQTPSCDRPRPGTQLHRTGGVFRQPLWMLA